MPEIKLPQKELILFAFIGGIIISLLELTHMLANRENVFDPFFWGGAIVAGLIGVIGLLLSQTKDIGGAITAGMAAPQLLSGITNVAPAAMTFIFNSIVTPVYAQDDVQMLQQPDSIEIVVIVEGTNKILELNSGPNQSFVKDTAHLKIQKDEKFSISGDNMEDVNISFDDALTNVAKDTSKEYIVKVNVVEYVPQQKRQQSFLRGLLGHGQRKKPQAKQKLEVKVEEKDSTSGD